MTRCRSRLLRALLALLWMVGTGAMAAEAMLPDSHVPHQHQGISVSDAGPDGADVPDHAGADACHCAHTHVSGLVAAPFTLPSDRTVRWQPLPQILVLHSLPHAPPRQPPRA